MNFTFRFLKGDVLGGLTAGIVALPLALAFGVSSGLGPSAGLYGAIFISFFAVLFGGTPTQISGPTAPMTAVSMVDIASQIPAAVLAGIFITVGIGVMDYRGLRALSKIPCSEVGVMFVVLVLAVVWNLVYAVGIGLVLASLSFMKKMGDVTHEMSEVAPVQKEKAWNDQKLLSSEFLSKVFIKHIEGPLFFGFTIDFQALSKQLPDSAKVVIIRMERVPLIDQSGLFALEDILIELTQKGITPFLEGVREQLEYMMQTIGILNELIPEEHQFSDFESCRLWLTENLDRFH
jgi:SulP family sulfate permease